MNFVMAVRDYRELAKASFELFPSIPRSTWRAR